MEYHAKEKPKYFTNYTLGTSKIIDLQITFIERYFHFLVENRSISLYNHSYYISTR